MKHRRRAAHCKGRRRTRQHAATRLPKRPRRAAAHRNATQDTPRTHPATQRRAACGSEGAGTPHLSYEPTRQAPRASHADLACPL